MKVGDESYIMPLSMVNECVELTRDDVEASHGRNLVNVHGGMIPYISKAID